MRSQTATPSSRRFFRRETWRRPGATPETTPDQKHSGRAPASNPDRAAQCECGTPARLPQKTKKRLIEDDGDARSNPLRQQAQKQRSPWVSCPAYISQMSHLPHYLGKLLGARASQAGRSAPKSGLGCRSLMATDTASTHALPPVCAYEGRGLGRNSKECSLSTTSGNYQRASSSKVGAVLCWVFLTGRVCEKT